MYAYFEEMLVEYGWMENAIYYLIPVSSCDPLANGENCHAIVSIGRTRTK
jgi:hypothetical protein